MDSNLRVEPLKYLLIYYDSSLIVIVQSPFVKVKLHNVTEETSVAVGENPDFRHEEMFVDWPKDMPKCEHVT